MIVSFDVYADIHMIHSFSSAIAPKSSSENLIREIYFNILCELFILDLLFVNLLIASPIDKEIMVTYIKKKM